MNHQSPEVPDADASGASHCFGFAAGRQTKAPRPAFGTPPCRISVPRGQMSAPDLQRERTKRPRPTKTKARVRKGRSKIPQRRGMDPQTRGPPSCFSSLQTFSHDRSFSLFPHRGGEHDGPTRMISPCHVQTSIWSFFLSQHTFKYKVMVSAFHCVIFGSLIPSSHLPLSSQSS